jgi:cyanophycinase-like exopeptidase
LIDGLGLIPIVTLPHFGAERINRAKALRQQLDRTTRLFGIAERTSAIWDGSQWNVLGPGAVIEVLADDVKTHQSGESFQ